MPKKDKPTLDEYILTLVNCFKFYQELQNRLLCAKTTIIILREWQQSRDRKYEQMNIIYIFFSTTSTHENTP